MDFIEKEKLALWSVSPYFSIFVKFLVLRYLNKWQRIVAVFIEKKIHNISPFPEPWVKCKVHQICRDEFWKSSVSFHGWTESTGSSPRLFIPLWKQQWRQQQRLWRATVSPRQSLGPFIHRSSCDLALMSGYDSPSENRMCISSSSPHPRLPPFHHHHSHFGVVMATKPSPRGLFVINPRNSLRDPNPSPHIPKSIPPLSSHVSV